MVKRNPYCHLYPWFILPWVFHITKASSVDYSAYSHLLQQYLDLIFTSVQDRIVDIQFPTPLPNCDHVPLVFSYYICLLRIHPPNNLKPMFYGIKATTKVSTMHCVILIIYINSPTNLLKTYDRFAEIINQLILLYGPIRMWTGSSQLPGKTKPPRDFIRRRHIAWTHFKSVRQIHGKNSIISNGPGDIPRT